MFLDKVNYIGHSQGTTDVCPFEWERASWFSDQIHHFIF